jgi:hypothetical protein
MVNREMNQFSYPGLKSPQIATVYPKDIGRAILRVLSCQDYIRQYVDTNKDNVNVIDCIKIIACRYLNWILGVHPLDYIKDLSRLRQWGNSMQNKLPQKG